MRNSTRAFLFLLKNKFNILNKDKESIHLRELIGNLNADRNSVKLSIKYAEIVECLEPNYSQLPLNTWSHGTKEQ